MSKLSQLHIKLMPYIIWALRIIIGITFIISGLTKMIDVWGFTYKIEQYLNVWGWEITRSLIVIAAMSLSAIEFVIGVMIFAGCYKRTAVWIGTAIMAMMLPFSAYIMIANPVDDCGCFGDFLIISNVGTFIKNIFISFGIIYLCINNHKKNGLFHPYVQWAVASVSYIYILIIGFIGYNVQPLIDFRPFKEATSLANNFTQDNSDFEFIYKKNGKKQSFNITNLPDSTWTFIDRIETKSTTDNNNADNKFIIYDTNDNDITTETISNDGKQLLILVPEIEKANISYSFLINEMNNYITQQGGNLIGIFATKDKNKIEHWADISLAQWPIYLAEDTSIKELARGKIAVVYLEEGVIKWKRTLSSIPSDIFSSNKNDNPLSLLHTNGERQFLYLSLAFIAITIIFSIFNWIIMSVKSHFSRKNKKKNVTLQNEIIIK